MKNKANRGGRVVSPVLNRVAKWEVFVLNRVGVLGPGGTPLLKPPLCAPPPHSPWAPGLPKGRNLGSFISVWVTHSNTPCTPLEHTSIDNSNIPVGVGGGGGLPYKSDGGACQKMKMKPLRKTNVGVAQA